MCKYGHQEHWCAGTCPITKGLRPFLTKYCVFCVPCEYALKRATADGAFIRTDRKDAAKSPYRCHLLAKNGLGYPLSTVTSSLKETIKEMCPDCDKKGRPWPDSDDEPEPEKHQPSSAYQCPVPPKDDEDDEHFMVMPLNQGFSNGSNSGRSSRSSSRKPSGQGFATHGSSRHNCWGSSRSSWTMAHKAADWTIRDQDIGGLAGGDETWRVFREIGMDRMDYGWAGEGKEFCARERAREAINRPI